MLLANPENRFSRVVAHFSKQPTLVFSKMIALIVLIFFHILVLQEYWVLTENRIPLKPVLGDVIIFAHSISSNEQT